jgi:hypothetical protein
MRRILVNLSQEIFDPVKYGLSVRDVNISPACSVEWETLKAFVVFVAEC